LEFIWYCGVDGGIDTHPAQAARLVYLNVVHEQAYHYDTRTRHRLLDEFISTVAEEKASAKREKSEKKALESSSDGKVEFHVLDPLLEQLLVFTTNEVMQGSFALDPGLFWS